MKSAINLMLIAACAFIYPGANAQTIEKGKNLIEGEISFARNTSKDGSMFTEANSFFVLPSYGRFVKDNLAVGVKALYAHADHDKSKINQFGGGVFLKRYFELGNRFYFTLSADALVAGSKAKSTFSNNSDSLKTTQVSLGLTPGITYNIYKKLYLDLSFPNVAGLNYYRS